MYKGKQLLTSICVLSILFPMALFAAEEEKPFAGNLLGDMSGKRTLLQNKGVDITLEYKGDTFGVVSGGIKKGTNYLDNLDIKFALDGEKIANLHGNHALIYFLNNDGGKPNTNGAGSIAGVDNIEVTSNAFHIYEAWDEQSFAEGKASILVGLHDLNSEFYSTKISGNFLKPEYGISSEMAATGQNGPSIFPITSLAARFKITPTPTSYGEFAVFNQTPDSSNHLHGLHIDFNKNGGVLLIAEFGLTPALAGKVEDTPNKLGVGVWRYTKKVDDIVDTDAAGNPLKQYNQGLYFLSGRQIYTDSSNPAKHLQAFFRSGMTDGNVTNLDYAVQSGIVAGGFVPSRPDAEMGFSVSQTHNAKKFIRAAELAGTPMKKAEYGLEFYYRDSIYRGVTIQPDMQYIINPGTDPAIENAWIVGMRVDISF